MPRGFGRGAGWWWFGYGGYPFWGWRGRGNPFPFCRWFPWLPRWWWATPYAGSYAATIPYYLGYPYSPGYMPPYGYPGYGAGYPGTAAPSAGAPTK